MGSARAVWQAIPALVGAAALWAAEAAGALPWPHPAGASLASLLCLVAVTRITAALALPLHGLARHAVAGIAIAAGSWFVTAAFTTRRPALVLLGALHIAAAWLAAGGDHDPGRRHAGARVTAGAMIAVSLVALLAPSLTEHAPVFVATAVVGLGAWIVETPRRPDTPAPPR